MNDLASNIRNYYFRNLSSLPTDKQFHFASRLSSWSEDPEALQMLTKMEHELATTHIKTDLEELIKNPPRAKINAAEKRAPYFAKYPELRGYMLALFRVRHLLVYYNIDARNELLELIPLEVLYNLSDRLQQDVNAVAILSTYAINYIYLVEEILFSQRNIPLDNFLRKIIAQHDSQTDSPEDTLLLIYLFTHCIIGASNFYQQRVSAAIYTEMLTILEEKINQNFSKVNLDNKFEYLVCCELVSFNTLLRKQINEEASESISPDGMFLIDTINTAGQSNKTSFADSEHRNVLFVMSNTPFIR